MWVLDMNAKNEKSPTEVPDALSAVMSSNYTSAQASGAFIGLREVGSMTSEGFSRISKSSSIPNGAEAKESRKDGSSRSHLSPRSRGAFLSRIKKTDSCWKWVGRVSQRGYGLFGRAFAHRLSYTEFVGEIPSGKALDHLCRNHGCVNPTHLEPVTWRENTLRGVNHVALQVLQTACKRGHAFTPENTRVSRGRRHCRKCCALRCAMYARGEAVNG